MNFGLDEVIPNEEKLNKPSNLDFIYYLFWEKGIDYDRFSKLPLPYIFSILQTHNYVKEQELKEMKKANRKKR